MSKPQPKPETVCVGYIHPGQCSSYFTQSLVNLLMWDQLSMRRVTGCLNEWSSANVSAARNSVTRQFLDDKDADWLLWIDADMAFPHTALEDLLKSAHPKRAPIVGGLCFGATYDRLFPTIYQMTETEDGRLTTLRVNDYPDGQMVPCAASGAAFLLVHRDVLVSMRDRKFNEAFPWFQETEIAGMPAGEDLTFCLRAGQLGYPIYVDTAVKVGHHKSVLYTHEMFQAQKAAPT